MAAMQPDMPSSRRWPISPTDWCSPACAGWSSPVVKLQAPWSIASGFPASSSAQEIAAGVPVLRAVGAKNGEMLLALKSGNFGGPEFFSDALKLMR